MARTNNKKVTEQAPVQQEVKTENQPQIISITFNSNNYLFGIAADGSLYRYEPENRKWVKA